MGAKQLNDWAFCVNDGAMLEAVFKRTGNKLTPLYDVKRGYIFYDSKRERNPHLTNFPVARLSLQVLDALPGADGAMTLLLHIRASSGLYDWKEIGKLRKTQREFVALLRDGVKLKKKGT